MADLTIKEWDEICKKALDCSMYYHASLKHEIIVYRLYWN